MAFDLTAHLANQERHKRAGMIRQACREISACPCPVKRARAVVELRKLQRLAIS
jgi:hypothetical protein